MLKPKSFQHNNQIKIKHPRSSLPSHRKSSIGFKPLRQSINANLSIIDHTYAYIQNKAKEKQKQSKPRYRQYSERLEIKATNKQCYSSASNLHNYNANQSCLSEKVLKEGKSQRDLVSKSKRQKLKERKENEENQKFLPKQYIKSKNISHRASISDSINCENNKPNSSTRYQLSKATESKINSKNSKKSFSKQHYTINPKQKPFRSDSIQTLEDLDKVKKKIEKSVASSRNQAFIEVFFSKFIWLSIIRLCFIQRIQSTDNASVPIKWLKKMISNAVLHLVDHKKESKYQQGLRKDDINFQLKTNRINNYFAYIKKLIRQEQQISKINIKMFPKISHHSLLNILSIHQYAIIDFQMVMGMLIEPYKESNKIINKNSSHLRTSYEQIASYPEKIALEVTKNNSIQQFQIIQKKKQNLSIKPQSKKPEISINKKIRPYAECPMVQEQNVQTARFKEKNENLSKKIEQSAQEHRLKKINLDTTNQLSLLPKSKLVESIQIIQSKKSRQFKQQQQIIQNDKGNAFNQNKSKQRDNQIPYSNNQDEVFPQQSGIIETELAASACSIVSRFCSSIKHQQSILDDCTQSLEKVKTKWQKQQQTQTLQYRFLCQLLDNQLYTNSKGAFFHAIKISFNMHQDEYLIDFLNCVGKDIRNYLSCISAVKLVNCNMPILLQIVPNLSKSLNILNISNNNLHSLSIFEDSISASNFNSGQSSKSSVPNLLINLQFLNISNNKIRNIHQLLQIETLKELHCRNNLIDHVTGDIKAVNLNMIDLAHNQIKTEYDLYAFSTQKQLKIINIEGNPIIQSQYCQFKVLSEEILQQYEELYIFSDYKQYKDITFNSSSQLLHQKDQLITYFNIGQNILTNTDQKKFMDNKQDEFPSTQSPIVSPKRKNISSFNWKRESYTNNQYENSQTPHQPLALGIIERIENPSNLKSQDKYMDSLFNIEKNVLKRMEKKFQKKTY